MESGSSEPAAAKPAESLMPEGDRPIAESLVIVHGKAAPLLNFEVVVCVGASPQLYQA
jgi:hypothetical protein